MKNLLGNGRERGLEKWLELSGLKEQQGTGQSAGCRLWAKFVKIVIGFFVKKLLEKLLEWLLE